MNVILLYGLYFSPLNREVRSNSRCQSRQKVKSDSRIPIILPCMCSVKAAGPIESKGIRVINMSYHQWTISIMKTRQTTAGSSLKIMFWKDSWSDKEEQLSIGIIKLYRPSREAAEAAAGREIATGNVQEWAQFGSVLKYSDIYPNIWTSGCKEFMCGDSRHNCERWLAPKPFMTL